MKLYSFDILDTCLCRTCGEPYAVFDLLAREVMGDNLTPSQLSDFRYMREKAEKTARKEIESEDISINQIYNYFDTSWLGKISVTELIEKELSIERKVLSPILKTKEIIQKYHIEGHCIYFISDMYLPSSFFKEILKDMGFWKEGDKIFVSCEIGMSKSTGNLFKYIKETEHLSYKRWIHYGDNRHSDYNVPRSLGISCAYIKEGYSYYQEKILKTDYCIYENYMGRCAGISRSICLAFPNDAYYKFAADIIAPIYVSFVFSVLADAQNRGIKKLFFLARDGFLPYLIAKQLESTFPTVKPHYLYVSRKSLYLPSLDEITEASVLEILPEANSFSKEEYFDNLQLNKDVIQKVRERTSITNLLGHVERIWEEQKTLVIDYFLQEGVACKKSEVAIVDIRGRRNCQKSINKILRRNGYSDVFAYYLEANADRINPTSSDEYLAYFFSDFVRGRNFNNMSTSVFLLERYFCISDQQRTAGYERNISGIIVPKYDNEIIPDVYRKIETINKLVCSVFCNSYIQNKLYNFNSMVLNSSLSIFSSFAKKPNREYLSVLLPIRFSETQYKDVRIIGMITPKRIYNGEIKWIRGSLMYMCPFLLSIYDIVVRTYKRIKMFFY